MSIHRRLQLSLLVLWITVLTAVAWIVVERSHHEVEELLDAELAQMAHVLSDILATGSLREGAATPQHLSPIGHPYESKISSQIWRGEELIAVFGAAPRTRLGHQLAYSDLEIGPSRWRVFGFPAEDGEHVVYVAQDNAVRDELVHYLTSHALQPLVWSLPVAMLLIWLAVTDGLRGLKRLAVDITNRSSSRLLPLTEEGMPAEIRPLIGSLNGLLARLRTTLALEQRFAADASHELRTPLAIIRVNAQIAQRAEDEYERQQALQEVIGGVDRAARLITQLLALARLGYDRPKRISDSGSLLVAVADVVEERRPAATGKGIDLLCDLPNDDDGPVGVPTSMLELLIGNLVDNAIKFSPPGGRVSVRVRTFPDRLTLIVADCGPGIPAAERDRAFERFYRGGHEQSGAGLGLSIVKRICDLYGIDIELGDASACAGADRAAQDGTGLCVETAFARIPERFSPASTMQGSSRSSPTSTA